MKILARCAAFLTCLVLLGCTGDGPPDDGQARPGDERGDSSGEAFDSAADRDDRGGASASRDSVMDSRLDSLFQAYESIDIPPVDTSGGAEWVEQQLSSMSLAEKVGQLFIVHLDASRSEANLNAVRHLHVGGFLVPRLLEPREVYRHVRRLQDAAALPLFFAADYERGVGRFTNALTELPSNMAIGATRDVLWAAAAGRLTAIESRAIGVNLLFAPVVDVNSNPDNPIINIRSYGEDPELVGQMAAAFVRAAQDHGLLTTLKHFPGHGDTNVDTHARMGSVSKSLDELQNVELQPYRTVLDEADPAAIMSAHLWIPALEPDPLPATFSTNILTVLLRNELGFKGIVVTDDIRMGALQSRFSAAERILRPLEAGANVVLTPSDVGRAIEIVSNAVATGRLSEAQIDASVRRILTAKAAAGLHRQRVSDEVLLDELLQVPLGEPVARAIAEQSITVYKDGPALPVAPDARIATVHITNVQRTESIPAAMDLLDDRLDVATSARFESRPSSQALDRVLSDAAEADVVVVALYLRLQAGRGEAGLLQGQGELVEALTRATTPVVLVTFGNPYAAAEFANADAVVIAYDQALATITAVSDVLTGREQTPGRLPITIE